MNEKFIALDQLQAGNNIQAWADGSMRHEGTVEQTAPHLNVLWILEKGKHSRKLLESKAFSFMSC